MRGNSKDLYHAGKGLMVFGEKKNNLIIAKTILLDISLFRHLPYQPYRMYL